MLCNGGAKRIVGGGCITLGLHCVCVCVCVCVRGGGGVGTTGMYIIFVYKVLDFLPTLCTRSKELSRSQLKCTQEIITCPNKIKRIVSFTTTSLCPFGYKKQYINKKAWKQSFSSNQKWKYRNELVFISGLPNKIIGDTLELESARARGLGTAHIRH